MDKCVVEPLDKELQSRKIVRGALIYQANSTQVYNGIYEQVSTQVAIKVQTNLNSYACTMSRREYENQLAIPQHNHIIQLYDYFYFEQDVQRYVFVIIIQYVDKDIYKEMTYRKRNNFPWSFSDLLKIAKDLIEVLALLQRRGIAHRDIKPQNLFVDNRKCVMLGDFGSSVTLNVLESEYTITGTPFYMSPELKELLMRLNSSRGLYSPIKSDVYSLGITLLSMYKLDPPTSLTRLDTLHMNTSLELQTVSDPIFRSLLEHMLIIEPKYRPDFQQLEELLRQGGQDIHYSMTIPGITMDCEHVAQGMAEHFNYPCHGRFCQNCIPAIIFLRYEGFTAWYQVKCPICLALYEAPWEVENTFITGSSNTENQDVSIQGTGNRLDTPLSPRSPNTPSSHEELKQTPATQDIPKRSLVASFVSTNSSHGPACQMCAQPIGSSINRNMYESEVVLNCLHKFCSRKCFVNFYEFESKGYKELDVKCRQCQKPIEITLAEEVYGGKYLFDKAIEYSPHKTRLCSICLANIGTRQVHDTHWYCEGCFIFLCQPKVFRNTVNCPDCLSTLKGYSENDNSSKEAEQQTGCCRWGSASSTTVARHDETDDGGILQSDGSEVTEDVPKHSKRSKPRT